MAVVYSRIEQARQQQRGLPGCAMDCALLMFPPRIKSLKSPQHEDLKN